MWYQANQWDPFIHSLFSTDWLGNINFLTAYILKRQDKSTEASEMKRVVECRQLEYISTTHGEYFNLKCTSIECAQSKKAKWDTCSYRICRDVILIFSYDPTVLLHIAGAVASSLSGYVYFTYSCKLSNRENICTNDTWHTTVTSWICNI